MAHKIGAEFHLPHGRINAILLPYVIKYNGVDDPTKFVSFPKYEYFIADKKYADLARRLGLPAKTTQEGVNSLIKAIKDLMKNLDMHTSFKQENILEEDYKNKVSELAQKAFEDQCTTANPKLPLISELEQILKDAYNG